LPIEDDIAWLGGWEGYRVWLKGEPVPLQGRSRCAGEDAAAARQQERWGPPTRSAMGPWEWREPRPAVAEAKPLRLRAGRWCRRARHLLASLPSPLVGKRQAPKQKNEDCSPWPPLGVAVGFHCLASRRRVKWTLTSFAGPFDPSSEVDDWRPWSGFKGHRRKKTRKVAW